MPKPPKKKCCVSKPRCQRCPLRMLAEGRLPQGYTVKKRRLVKVEDAVRRDEVAAKKSERKGKGNNSGKKGKKGKKRSLPQAA